MLKLYQNSGILEKTRNETPPSMYLKGKPVELSGKVEDLSKTQECKKDGGLNRVVPLKVQHTHNLRKI